MTCHSSFSIRSRVLLSLLAILLVVPAPVHVQQGDAPKTEVLMLSGHGPEDAVPWEFFCTTGRRSREWTTIPVPSCWEQHGFGGYNYGNEINADATVTAGEQGLYRRSFTVPAEWRGRTVRLVFDGSMTDTTVWVNGRQAGATHQGAFYRFHYDITPLVKFGEPNRLEVTVSKMSSSRSVNNAERAADYWVFGGIFRPVWLEGRPAVSIERTAIDARADGQLSVDVFLAGVAAGAQVTAQVIDGAGASVGDPLRAAAGAGAKVTLRGRVASPRRWTAETPNLYRLQITLASGGAPVHSATERFGFRTIEVREGDGVYLNGSRIILKGVNRHAFWPETGRTVTRDQSYADVRLMKEANLNAVRMSHYPPDEHFLEACDELGLYVLDELGGWQKAYSTEIGARLVGELIRRDVNHPSIVFWDNGNEGGWNEKNDGEFAKWDPQGRAVLHPRGVSGGINTLHYAKYDKMRELSAGPQLYMPTEFLHGLYDGGIGAGLRDYWDVMGASRTVAGGFFWVWSDEGVARTDQDGRIDTAGNQAPDGMTGPHREKEASYFSVKEIWSPIQVSLPVGADERVPADWNGSVGIENGYDFTPLDQCRIAWQLLQFAPPSASAGATSVLAAGQVSTPPIAPRTRGTARLPLPRNWRDADAVQVTAKGPSGESLWTWSARVRRSSVEPAGKPGAIQVTDAGGSLTVNGPAGSLRFDKRTGLLVEWRRGEKAAPMGAGPTLQAYRRHDRTHEPIAASSDLVSLDWHRDGLDTVVEARWSGILQQATWRFHPGGDGVRLDYAWAYNGQADLLGVGFALPPAGVTSKRWLGRGPYRVYRNRMEGSVFDVHQVAFNDPVPGQSFTYPEFKGYFRDWQWLQLQTDAGRITVQNASGVPFVGLYGPRDGEPSMLAFPDTGLAFLHVIPAQGTKFDTPEFLGPQSRTPSVSGTGRGSVEIRFEAK
jgi:hypothetical protein